MQPYLRSPGFTLEINIDITEVDIFFNNKII